MVRRIGFGTPDTGRTRKPTIKREIRKFGIKPVAPEPVEDSDGKPRFTERFENPLVPRHDYWAASHRAYFAATRRAQLIAVILSVWILGWSYGLYLLGDSNGIIIGVWFWFGLLGWIPAVFILLKKRFGKDVKKSNDP